MKRVCYVLGAGFSAYAGLPVMANFIDKAKDIYFSDVNCDYKDEIKKTLDSIKEYAIIKEYMNCDLSNIEELLSIADMKSYSSKKSSSRNIQSFIKGVIKYYEDLLFSNYEIIQTTNELVTNRSKILDLYIKFICSVFQLKVSSQSTFEYKELKFATRELIHYDLITLNYDTILENILNTVNDRCTNDNLLRFNRGKEQSNVRYCKLHGSIDMDEIIPPTWAKNLKSNIKQDWVDAHDIIKNSNEIRIIGFSFPNTDSHISYLFKSAIGDNENLKSIDVLCLDNNTNYIREKYQNIFCTKKFHFVNDRVENYFQKIGINKDPRIVAYDRLEEAHSIFFGNLL